MRSTEIVDGVHFFEGPNSNWVILENGSTCALIDSGYPRDLRRVRASIQAVLGNECLPSEIFITHAHADHIGTAAWFHRAHGTPVLVHANEISHAKREVTQQISFELVRSQLWKPRVLWWTVRAVLAGGLELVAVQAPKVIVDGHLQASTGHRMRVIPSASHTAGSVAYVFGDAGPVVSGDLFVSAHPYTGVRTPHLLPAIFHHDASTLMKDLRELVDVHLAGYADETSLLPGHGPIASLGSVREWLQQLGGQN